MQFRFFNAHTAGTSGRMNSDKAKLTAATLLYRWQSAQGILGAMLSALTFAGVFTLLLGPVFSQLFGSAFGYSETLLLLLGLVAAVFLGFGTFLDRGIQFWAAQAKVGTMRNPFLIDALYQKELLTIATVSLPTLRALYAATRDPRAAEELLTAIARLEDTVRDKKWEIRPGEEAY